jgi:hypothetical protein
MQLVRLLVALLTLFVASIAFPQPAPERQIDARIDPTLGPQQSALVRRGGVRLAVAASRDDDGIQSDFVVGVVVIESRSSEQVSAFLSRFGGRVLWTDAVPVEALRALGAPGDAGAIPATHHGVLVDLGRASLADLPARIRAAGLRQGTSFSSTDGLRTFALTLAARENGFAASAAFLAYPHEAFPQTLFKTNEGGSDGFTVSRYGFNGDGAQANIISAWQFVAAHGIAQRVRVAVIDGGFYLAGDGPQTDSDFPAQPPQWNFEDGGPSAGGPSPSKCFGGQYACPWHGTGAAGVAAGIINNGRGKAGVGGMVGDLMLLKRDSSHYFDAVAAAIGAGADVVSMSFGGGCNYWCRVWGPSASALQDYADAGGKAVFVASAGNDGRPVDDDGGWVRPCTLGPVICVGALADGTTSRWFGTSPTPPAPASNYGSRVDVFAPQGIPVMSYPNLGTNTPVPQVFGATSSAAPVVSGVVAMMKAINPDLGPLQVRQILRDTAHPGVGDAPRALDALAAVRAAAAGIPIVKDALGGLPKDLGEVTEAGQEDLNIDGTKRQTFHFRAPRASALDVTLTYPHALGAVELRSMFDASSACAASVGTGLDDHSPSPVGDPGVTQHLRVYHYRISGGAHSLVVGADDVNAYDIHLSVRPDTIAPDAYEPNDAFVTARRIGGFPLTTSTVDISATLHTPVPGASADRDVFIVRGSDESLAGFFMSKFGVNAFAFPAIQLSQFQSSITLDVYRRNADGSVGAVVAQGLHADACTPNDLVVQLEANRDYFVVVTGEPGAYELFNGGRYTVERVNYINLEDILSRPGPVEISEDTRFLLTPDPSWRALVSDNDRIHLAVLDPRTGTVLREAVRDGQTERLDLAGLSRDRGYFLRVRGSAADTPRMAMRLKAVEGRARRTSRNLLRDDRGGIDLAARGWVTMTGGPGVANLDSDSAAATRRAVITGGANGDAVLRQLVPVPDDWRRATSSGLARARITAQLGGQAGSTSFAYLQLSYLDRSGTRIASFSTPPVRAEDRNGLTALLPIQSVAPVPPTAQSMEVRINFDNASRDSTNAYADAVSLTLEEFDGR